MYKRGVSRKLIALYIVFILMTITGLVSVVSGVILWLAGDGGNRYQGGQQGRSYESTINSSSVPGSNYVALGLERSLWKSIHIYLSLTCVAIVVLHTVLNWKRITCATQVIFKQLKNRNSSVRNDDTIAMHNT